VRIASLVPSATEMLFALGLGESVVAVTHECDYPPAVGNLPDLTASVLSDRLEPEEVDAAVKAVLDQGRPLYRLDEELLAELRPDLIVTQALCPVCAVSYEEVVEVAACIEGGPTVLRQDPGTLGEMLDDVLRLGEAAGAREAARELRAELEGRLAAVREAVAGAGRPRVIALEWLDPPFVGGHWIPEMISIAGGEDVAGPAGHRSPQVDWSDLTGLEPEVVVAMPCGWYLEDSREQAVRHSARIARLGAPRVFAVDAASSFSRPGPRLVDGVELLAHLLHPESVGDPGGIGFAEIGIPTPGS
jgi:iron complex transport system substrate-binding protein